MNKKYALAVAITALFTAPSGWAADISETEGGNTFATAQNINGNYSSEAVTNIFNSTTVPHVSIAGNNNATADIDYYSFTATAGQQGFFDIDGAEGAGYGTVNLDTVLALFDASHNLLAYNYDTSVDPGSIATNPYLELGINSMGDSFIGVYNFLQTGTYYLGVSSRDWFAVGSEPTVYGTSVGALTRPDAQYGGDAYAGNSGPSGLSTAGPYSSGTYTLHVSVGNAVPEPSDLALMTLGLSGLLFYRRKKA